MENLYYPLKETCDDININSIKFEFEKEGISVIDIKVRGFFVEVEIVQYHLNDEETILTILEDFYRKSFVFIAYLL